MKKDKRNTDEYQERLCRIEAAIIDAESQIQRLLIILNSLRVDVYCLKTDGHPDKESQGRTTDWKGWGKRMMEKIER